MEETSESLMDHSFEDESPSELECVPIEVLFKIFSFLDLRMRGKAARVCRRWQDAIYSPRCEMDDIMVVNIFERAVWDSTISKNKALRVEPVEVEDAEGLQRIFRIMRTANTVKFWYQDTSFANQAIDTVVSGGLKLKTIDLYPYGNEMVTDHVWDKIPELTGLAMRPHGHEYFWNPMKIDSFPNFQALTTLCVDSISFGKHFSLPPNLTTFEFQNRSENQYLILLDQIKELKKLEYFSISHANMEKVCNFVRFLDSVDASNIPTLTYLTLKFCKLPTREKYYEIIADAEPIVLGREILNLRKMNLRMLKLDLCCGEIYSIGRSIIDFNRLLTVLALQIIEEADTVNAVRRLSEVAENKKVWMHLGIMQRDAAPRGRVLRLAREPDGSDEASVEVRPPLPKALFKVLSKFEASFMWNQDLLNEILGGPISAVQEIKLINCDSVIDSHLETIAQNAPMLRRLTLIKCKSISDRGLMPFVEHFDRRRTQKLEIVWKRRVGASRPASIFLDLMRHKETLLGGKSAKFFAKVFNDDDDGERIVVEDKTRNKKLFIQDFSDADGCQLIGVIVGAKVEETPEPSEPPSEEPPPPPTTLLEKLTVQSSV